MSWPRLLLCVQFRSKNGPTNELARTKAQSSPSAMGLVPESVGCKYQEVGNLGYPDVLFRHWFSFMGMFLPFEIITYAIWRWKTSRTDSRLSNTPKATAGTSRVVKWARRKLCTTQ